MAFLYALCALRGETRRFDPISKARDRITPISLPQMSDDLAQTRVTLDSGRKKAMQANFRDRTIVAIARISRHTGAINFRLPKAKVTRGLSVFLEEWSLYKTLFFGLENNLDWLMK